MKRRAAIVLFGLLTAVLPDAASSQTKRFTLATADAVKRFGRIRTVENTSLK
jgi:hypothetical protein